MLLNRYAAQNARISTYHESNSILAAKKLTTLPRLPRWMESKISNLHFLGACGIMITITPPPMLTSSAVYVQQWNTRKVWVAEAELCNLADAAGSRVVSPWSSTCNVVALCTVSVTSLACDQWLPGYHWLLSAHRRLLRIAASSN